MRHFTPILGASIIIVFLFTALLGIVFIPDKSKSSNESVTQLRKLTPGTDVEFIKVPKPFEVIKESFWEKYLIGGNLNYNLEPVRAVEFSGLTVLYRDYYDEVHKLDMGKEFVDSQFSSTLYEVSQSGLLINGELYPSDVIRDWFLEERMLERSYLLGADSMGRDVFSRLVYGSKISVSVGFIAVLISLVIGVLVGAIAGFFGGWIDVLLTWLITVIWSIPGIMLIIAISMALNSKGIWVVFIAVGLTMWVDVARIVRGQVLESKENLYVDAARALGVPPIRIIIRHILPNIIGPIIVVATANFAAAILVEAGLSFIGIGVEPPIPSWGSMIREGYDMMGNDIVAGKDSFGLLLWPSLAVSLLVFAFNLLGNGLRDVLDPKNSSNG